MRPLEQRLEARIHELRIERPGEVDVLVVKRDRKGAEEGLEGVRDGMLEQFFDRNLLQSEAAEEGVELADACAEIRLVIELRRLLREDERVLEREAGGLADELREEALEAGDEGGHGERTSRPSPQKCRMFMVRMASAPAARAARAMAAS